MAMKFGLKNQQAVSTRRATLKPWAIHDVKFEGVEATSFAGKKDPSKTYKVLRVTWSNNEGAFSETIFYPESEKDEERMEFNNTDKDGKPYTSYMASSYDRAMAFVAQIAATVNPEGWKKMQDLSDKFKSFDDVANALVKITEKHKNKEMQLKLIGRIKDGIWTSVLPTFVRINRDGEAYISDNFIGTGLSFTPSEEAKRKQYLNAAATPMEDSASDTTDVDTSSDDSLDLDDFDL